MGRVCRYIMCPAVLLPTTSGMMSLLSSVCLLEPTTAIFAREGKLPGSANLQAASCLMIFDNLRALGTGSGKQRLVFHTGLF